MPDFSASQAIGAGFRLIARRPTALLWWTGAYLLLGVLPQALGLWAVFPDVIGFYRQIASEAATSAQSQPDMSSLLAMQSRMQLLQLILLLSGLVSHTMLIGAIYRGVLQPAEDRFGYLRFSRQELWLGLSLAVLYVLVIALLVALAIVIGVVAAIVAVQAEHGGSSAIGSIVAAAAIIGGVGAAVWVLLRLSLALPMSFASGEFLMFESWSLTRGRVWKLFGVALALFAMLMLFEMVFLALFLGVGMGAMLHGHALETLFAGQPEDLVRRLLPWAPLWMIGGSLISVLVYAIVAAPWADIYRQLTAAEPAEA